MANPLIVNPYAKKKFSKEELATVPDLRPDLSEGGKGIRAFADETQATGYGVLALGAQQLKDSIGARDGGILDSAVQTGQEGYTRNMQEATAGRQAPNIARVEDIKDIGGGVDWAAYNLSKGLPQLATLAASGGVGAGVAKLAINKKLKDTAKAQVGEAVTKQVKDAAKAEIKKGINRGAMTGGFLGAFGLEGGHAMGQALEAGVDPSRAADAAVAVGGINGALEFLPFYAVAKKLGRGDFAKDSIRKIIKNDAGLSKRAVALATAKEASKRAGGAAAVGAGTESITEGLQELVNIAGLRWAEEEEMFADLDEEDWSAVRNGMAAGGLIGGFAGGGAGVFKGPGQAEQAAPVPEPEVVPEPSAPAPEVVLPEPEFVEPEPGTQGKLVGDPTLTPQYAEKKQPAGPGQELAQVPGLPQLPLQGELVEEETGLVVQGEQAQIENTPIEARFKDITGQVRIGEQKKLEAPVEIRDPKTNETVVLEDFWIEGIDDNHFLMFNELEDAPFSVTDKNGDLIVTGSTKEEALAGLAETLENEAAFMGQEEVNELTVESVDANPENTDFEDALGVSGMVKLADGYKLQTMPDRKRGVSVSDSIGEVHSTYPSVAEFEAAWFPDADNPTPILDMDEFQDPEIATQIDGLQRQVQNGSLTKEAAANQMAGLANQLSGDPTVVPPTLATKTSEMTKTGPQAGSNKGAWFSDKDGSDFYVKEGQTPDHAISEHIAQQLYALAGTDVPTTMLMQGDSEGFAGPVIASQRVQGSTQTPMKDGFVLDAWLGNWDVAGLANDNYLGTPEAGTRIDFGGALNYRAQGGKKGDLGTEAFGAKVGELKTLRDPIINPQAAKLFKNITDEDIIEQAGKLARLDDKAIYNIVMEAYGEQSDTIAEAVGLFATLVNRKENILKYAQGLKEAGPSKETAGTAEALQHWVKGVDNNAPLTEKLKYAMQDPHKGIWAEIPAADSRYGVLLINPDTGKVLLRKPKGDYDGYAWTFAKGKSKKNEHPSVTASRELVEETGYMTNIVGQLGKPFYSDTGTGALFYVGTVKGTQGKFGEETSELKWATYEEALALVKEGTKKQGVRRDSEILKNLFGTSKPDEISEFPIKKGAAHAKSYFQSGQFAEDAPWTPWKSKTWQQLTPLRQLYVKSAAYLKQLNKKNRDYTLSEADINKEVKRMQKAFKSWSGFSFMQVINAAKLPTDEADMLANFPLKTGVPFVTETYHGNSSGEIVGDLLNPAAYAGNGGGGSDTLSLKEEKGTFFMAATVAGAKAWAGNNTSKVFAFYFALKNPKVIWYDKGWNSANFKKGIKQAHADGHDGIVFVNAKDSGGKYHQLIAFDAQQQVRTRMLENVGYSLDEEAKTYESQGAKEATINPKEKFEHDFTNVFGEGVFIQAFESGLLTVNETSPEGSPAGLFNKETNKITINLDRVAEGESPMSVLLHEGRHAGMQDVLGETLPLFHQDLLDLADRGNADAQSSITRSTAAVADQLGIEHGLYDIGLPQSELEAEVKAIRKLIAENERGAGLLQEEDLAYYIQDAANTTDLSAPGLYRRLINALKVWWAQSGVGQMFAQAGLRAELTPEMAVELAKASVKKAVVGQGIQGEGMLASEVETKEAKLKRLQAKTAKISELNSKIAEQQSHTIEGVEQNVELAKLKEELARVRNPENYLNSNADLLASLAAEAIPPEPVITYKPAMSSKAYYESKAFVEEQPELMEEFTAVEPLPPVPEPEFDPLEPEIVGKVQMPVNLVEEKTIPPSTRITLTGQQGQRTVVKEVNARKAVALAKRRTSTLAEVIKCLAK